MAGQPRPWPRADKPRRAAVNSLGVGGTNAHVIVEEPPAVAASSAQGQWQVFTLSARTPASLARLKAKWLDFAADPAPGFDPANAAYTTQVGRKAFEHRCAVVARDAAGLREALSAASHPRCLAAQSGAAAPGVALMFPGGGAHYPGAGRELLARAAFARAVDDCFAAMPAAVPRDLRRVMFECEPSDAAAQSALERPGYALPALFTLEYALAKLWQSWGIQPSAVIGHSAGEYAAACLAGVMSLADALSVVALRGELFDAAPPGSMLSVDLPEPQMRALLDGLDLDIGAINAPDLCIVSGSLQAIAQLEARLRDKDLEGRRLRINVAAHSRLLDPVLGRFHECVSRIRLNAPTIPYVSTLTGNWADARELTDPGYWVSHLREPVRFAGGLQQLLDQAGTVLLEAGPGQGLCALARHNSGGRPRAVLASTCKAQEPGGDLAQMLAAAGGLWTRGCAIDWAAARGSVTARRASVPTYAFDHQRHWIEPGLQLATQAQPRPASGPQPRPALSRLPSRDDWFRVPEWRRSPLTQRRVARRPLAGAGQRLDPDRRRCRARPPTKAQRSRWCGAAHVRAAGGRQLRRWTPPTAADCDAGVLAALEQDRRLPDHIVHLWALDTVPVAPRGDLPVRRWRSTACLHIARPCRKLDVAQPMRLDGGDRRQPGAWTAKR